MENLEEEKTDDPPTSIDYSGSNDFPLHNSPTGGHVIGKSPTPPEPLPDDQNEKLVIKGKAVESEGGVDDMEVVAEEEGMHILSTSEEKLQEDQGSPVPATSMDRPVTHSAGSVRSEDRISILSRRHQNHSRESLGPQEPNETRSASSSQGSDGMFRAFPESKWLRSVVIAKIGFIIMTMMVLGNLIYSYAFLYATNLTAL